MRIIDFFARLLHRADRFELMVERLGVADDLQQLSDHAGVVHRAVDRCLGCGETEACQQWLDQNGTRESAPDYCPNHDLFERLLKSSQTTRTAGSPG